MPATSACPESASLQPFLIGALAPERVAELERHLERCDSCLAALRTLMADDTLAEAARHTPAPEAPAGAVEGLIERLSRLRPQADAADATALLGPPQAPDEIGRLGDYRVLGVLGSGGMGVVFRAEDSRLRRLVALKALRPELAARPALRERFLREARAAAALTPDHIVPVYQIGEDRAVLYLAMALLPGESLEERLRREGRLPLPELLRVGREVAEGLAAAHAAGLVHRDVKPANVWLEELPAGPGGPPRRRARLLDFGLARAAGDDAHLTQSGAIVGTPAYMAPEQARGEAPDPRADLFGLGVVLYRLATGELPFQGKDAVSVLLSVAQDRPKPPRQLNPDLPPALDQLILRLLAKDAADRPSSARAVVEALAAIEADLARPAGPPAAKAKAPRPEPQPDASRRRRVLRAVALTLAVTALAAGIIVIITSPDGQVVGRFPVPPGWKVEFVPDVLRPLSPWALVTRPTPLPGVLSWTLEPVSNRGGSVWEQEHGKLVALSPDGQQLATAVADRTIRVWDLKNGALRKALVGRVGLVQRLAWSPDGKLLGCGGQGVEIWEPATGQVRFRNYQAGGCVVWTLDGKRFATGGQPIRIWATADWGLLGELREGAGELAWSPDGQTLASYANVGTWDSPIILWDVKARKELRRWKANGWLARLAWSPDGKTLASHFPPEPPQFWDPKTGQLSPLAAKQWGRANALAWGPGGKAVAVVEGAHACIRDLASGKILQPLDGAGEAIYLDWSAAGTALAWMDQRGKIAAVDRAT